MKIALIYPSYGELRPPAFPSGLGYVASTLAAAGHEVVPLLMDVERHLSCENVAARVLDEGYEVVGISALVTRYRFVKELTRTVKRRCPDVPIVIGGKIADSIPDRLFEKTPVDAVCLGEGEFLAVELMEALAGDREMGSVDGVWHRDGDIVVRNRPREPIQNLDSVPFPAYHLFPMDVYLDSYPDWVGQLVPGASRPAYVQTNRGCPFSCTFCRREFETRRVRERSLGNILEELALLKDRYAIDSVIFNDELTLVSKKRALALAEGMRTSGLGLVWHCLARVDCIDREIVRELKHAGCASLGFGIESGSQLILDEMNKRVTVDDSREALRVCRQEGMRVNCTYMVGMPSETPETIRQTVEFMSDTGALGHLFFATAYPGTQLWEQVMATGKIPDVERYLEELNDATDYVANFTSMTEETLLAQYGQAMEEINAIRRKKQRRGRLRRTPERILSSFRERGAKATIGLAVRRGAEAITRSLGLS
jgi:radical SAM superfamily enzyme YgiQ (UPF0313 family)